MTTTRYVSTIRISRRQSKRVVQVNRQLGEEKKMAREKVHRRKGSEEAVAAFIGIDWADEKHDICLRVAGSGRREPEVIEHTPEALDEWVLRLRTRFGRQKIAVCLEQSRGPLVYALMKCEFLVLYPVNPKSLAAFRETFAPSRAKDDPSDAEFLLDLVTHHHDKLTPWTPDDVQTRKLALLVEARRQAVDLRTQLSNRLQSALKNYFPQALQWAGEELHTRIACDFLLAWPTLDLLKRENEETVRAFYYGHNCRRADLIEQRIGAIAHATPLTRDKAVIESHRLTVELLATQLRALIPSIGAFDEEIRRVFGAHPDAPIFASLPGAGDVTAPRLLAAFGSDRERFPLAEAMHNYSGIAPVTERSGHTCWVHWRWACPKFLRQSFHEFAGLSIRSSLWARAYYELQIERGKTHQAAVRALAFKWIRILHRCWQDRLPYDENHYIEALERRGSALLPRIKKLGEKQCA